MSRRCKSRRKRRNRLGLEISPDLAPQNDRPAGLHIEDSLKTAYKRVELGDRALRDDSEKTGSGSD